MKKFLIYNVKKNIKNDFCLKWHKICFVLNTKYYVMKKLVLMLALTVSLFSCKTQNETTELSLTQEEENDLLFLREEEKLARDVYLYAYDKYNFQVFANIAGSEQNHMDAVLALLEKYGLSDPASQVRGEFTNPDLQALYDQLTARVDVSLLEALKVGATIEDLDINDIETFKDNTDKSDLLSVYGRLECGSRNHMRSFYAELLTQGFTYTAQYISQQELEAIVNSTREQCGMY